MNEKQWCLSAECICQEHDVRLKTAEGKHVASFVFFFTGLIRAICDLAQSRGNTVMTDSWCFSLETPLAYFRSVQLGFVFLALAQVVRDLGEVELKPRLSPLSLC